MRRIIETNLLFQVCCGVPLASYFSPSLVPSFVVSSSSIVNHGAGLRRVQTTRNEVSSITPDAKVHPYRQAPGPLLPARTIALHRSYHQRRNIYNTCVRSCVHTTHAEIYKGIAYMQVNELISSCSHRLSFLVMLARIRVLTSIANHRFLKYETFSLGRGNMVSGSVCLTLVRVLYRDLSRQRIPAGHEAGLLRCFIHVYTWFNSAAYHKGRFGVG